MAMIAYFEDFEPKNDRRRYLRRALRLGAGSSDANRQGKRECGETMETKQDDFLLLKCGHWPETLTARR